MGEVTWRATKIYRQDIHVLSVTKRKHYTTQISAEHSSRETSIIIMAGPPTVNTFMIRMYCFTL